MKLSILHKSWRLRPLARLPVLLLATLLLVAVACAPVVPSGQPTTSGPSPLAPGEPADKSQDNPSGTATSGPVAGARPLVERNYQWTGVVEASLLEGRHLELRRNCDRWVLLPQSDAVTKKLEDNIGNKVLLWGTAFNGATIYMRQAISVSAAFGPDDPIPMTLVAIPEYPCPPYPTPAPLPLPPAPDRPLMLGPSQLAVRGTLIWEGGQPYLVTPAGKVLLTMPAQHATGDPGTTAPAAGADAARVMDAVAAGAWGIDRQALRLSAETLRAWPVSVALGYVGCGRPSQLESLQPGELAARGILVWDAQRSYLKTAAGTIWLSLTLPEPAARSDAAEATVVGKWSLSSSGLQLVVRRAGYTAQSCPPPPPPADLSLLPGELAAVGTLVWESGQPHLITTSGRIILDVPRALPLPSGATPDSAGGQASPQLALQVMAAGQWMIRNGQLVLYVRWLQPWPGSPPGPAAPPPSATAVPAPGTGILYGKVSIGPLCPVEPCIRPTADIYSSRSLLLETDFGETLRVPLNADGTFKAQVKSGVYAVNLTNCDYLGCSRVLPQKVVIGSNQAVELNIDIDTGIR